MNSGASFSRRHFLRSTTAIAAGLAAPAIVPASVLGRNGLIPPSERITMGFIGVGGQGSGHLLGGAWTYVAGGYAGRKDVQVLAGGDVWRERRGGGCPRGTGELRDCHSKGGRVRGGDDTGC